MEENRKKRWVKKRTGEIGGKQAKQMEEGRARILPSTHVPGNKLTGH